MKEFTYAYLTQNFVITKRPDGGYVDSVLNTKATFQENISGEETRMFTTKEKAQAWVDANEKKFSEKGTFIIAVRPAHKVIEPGFKIVSGKVESGFFFYRDVIASKEKAEFILANPPGNTKKVLTDKELKEKVEDLVAKAEKSFDVYAKREQKALDLLPTLEARGMATTAFRNRLTE